MNREKSRRVSSLDDLKAFFGAEPSAISADGWAMGVTFVIQDERSEFAWLEFVIAPNDADLQIKGYTRASSELNLSLTDATTWHIIEGGEKPKLVVGGSQTGLQEVSIQLQPVTIGVRFDW